MTDVGPPLCELPPEIHLKIFDLLQDDPEASACLGLTCRKFYPLFAARHLKTKLVRKCEKCGLKMDGPRPVHPKLDALAAKLALLRGTTSDPCNVDGHQEGWKTLSQLLVNWKPIGLVFVPHVNKFTSFPTALKIYRDLEAESRRKLMQYKAEEEFLRSFSLPADA